MLYIIFGSDLVDGLSSILANLFKIGRCKTGNFFELGGQMMHTAETCLVRDLR